MDDYDKTALLALLIKQVRAQEVVKEQKPILAAAEAAIKAATAEQALVGAALPAFGFDPKSAEMWNKVKEAIGPDMWNRAFEIARKRPPPPPEFQETSEESETDTDTDADEGDEGQSADSEDTKSSVPSANIREIVLDRLRAAGSEGIGTTAIRDFIAKSGREIHEKTVGMTLYRLAKASDKLVYRKGRTWYIANPEPKTPQPETEDENKEGSFFE